MTSAPVVILRPKLRPSSQQERMRLSALSDRAMTLVGRLTAMAARHGDRVHLAREIVRFGAVCLCHALGLRLAAAYLASLAGQILDEAEAEDGARLTSGGSRR